MGVVVLSAVTGWNLEVHRAGTWPFLPLATHYKSFSTLRGPWDP